MSARYWLVWDDDTPIGPENPYSEQDLYQAYDLMRELLRQDPNAKVEIRQCEDEDLEFAGIDPHEDDDQDEQDSDDEAGESK